MTYKGIIDRLIECGIKQCRYEFRMQDERGNTTHVCAVGAIDEASDRGWISSDERTAMLDGLIAVSSAEKTNIFRLNDTLGWTLTQFADAIEKLPSSKGGARGEL